MLRRFTLYVYLPAGYSFTRQVWDCRCVARWLRGLWGGPREMHKFSSWLWGEMPKLEVRSPFGPVLAVPLGSIGLVPPPPLYSASISYRILNFFYLVRSNAMHSSANNILLSLSTLTLVRWLTLLCLHP